MNFPVDVETDARLVAAANDPTNDRVFWWKPNPLPLMTSERGPDHEVEAGRYYAVIRNGVPMIQRSDTGGAVLAVACPHCGAMCSDCQGNCERCNE